MQILQEQISVHVGKASFELRHPNVLESKACFGRFQNRLYLHNPHGREPERKLYDLKNVSSYFPILTTPLNPIPLFILPPLEKSLFA
jgi:hypothetical protein